MAPNNFATKLSRNTNRITVILVYAFLEWLLMFFIFLNSLLTYSIVKFASFFGLKQVCILCPKLDRIFERNSENSFTYTEILCQNHILELASLNRANSLCSDCEEMSNIRLGLAEEKPYPSYLHIKSPIWGETLGHRENGGLILEMIDDDKIVDGFEIERESNPLGLFNEEAEEVMRHQNSEVSEEEEKTKEYPETPTSAKNVLRKRFMFLAEEATDVCKMDGGDPSSTIERLKEMVRSEQEALRGLYAELEEERSASAIAANQTMAMITRLQEEKAKVQMEALQYQRMMEEQAEYDQEALQLLNHLMVKREKEKEELQRELDAYKAKVVENGEEEEEDVDLEKMTLDCVNHMSMLDESLSEFEEERLVILDQLKVLEDKLLTMQDNEEEHEGVTMASMAKSLLPLLDAAENESEEEYGDDVEKSFGSESEEKLEVNKQVDSVYERLQMMEMDGEFLSSGKRGDEGSDLLRDILQHLRDLRNIELSDTIENQKIQDE